jgi:hypothetical protein
MLSFSLLLAALSLPSLAEAGKGKAGEEILNRRTLFSKGYKERIGLNKTARAALAPSSSSSSSSSTEEAATLVGKEDAKSKSRKLQTGGGGWSTEHFDISNSGWTTYIGPGDVTGFCRTPVIESSLLNPNRERFYATGVTTINDNDLNLKFWLGGGNRNQFRMIQIMGPASFQEWDLDLETIRPGYPNATTYGVISSGATWVNDVADNIALPSTDGTIYTLFWLSCVDSLNSYKSVMNGGGGASSSSIPRPAMHPIDAERMAMIESQKSSTEQSIPGYPTIYRVDPVIRARLLKYGPESTAESHPMTQKDLENDPFKDPFPTCVQWTAALGANGTKPSYSPTRFVPGLNGNPDLVLASESDPDLDTNGVLWAFNAKNGSVAWSHQAIDTNGRSWGLTGIVPAVDNTHNNVVFIAYGVSIWALNGQTGAVMGSLDASFFPDPSDPSAYEYISGSVDTSSNVIEQQTGILYDDAIAYCNSLDGCVGIYLRNGQGFDASDPYTFDPAATVYFMSILTPATINPQPYWRRFIIFQRPGFGADPFVSSPTLSAGRDALFLHSVYGTLFKVSITYVDANTVTFDFLFACDYLASVPNDQQACSYTPGQLYKQKLAYPVYTGSGDSFKVVASDVSKGEYVYRRDFVGGGWPQPTTRNDRDELYEMLKTTYLSSHSADELTAAASRHPVLADVSSASPPLTVQEAAAIMRVFRSEGREKMIHTMRTKSGYTRLDGRGFAIDVAEAAQREVEIETAKRASSSSSSQSTSTGSETPLVGLGGGGIWYSSYPFSTPAQRTADTVVTDDVLVVPQYLPYMRGTEGVFVVNQEDGVVRWSWNGAYTEEGQRVSFGRSRSSPAIDGDDYVYVGADTPDPFYSNRSGFTLPTLYAFDLSDGFLMWATGMGFATNTLVNSASPIITDGFQDANTAFMVADLGISYLNEGVSCPSDDPIFECSRYGTCDCNTGECTCSQGNKCVAGPECKPLCLNGDCDDSTGPPCSCYPCWRGDYCDTYQQCGNGFCQQSTDQCVCQPCFVQDGNGVCNTPLCGAHGTCAGFGTCTCTDGYTGPTCQTPPGPPPSPSPSNSPSALPSPNPAPPGSANAAAGGASPGLVGGLVAFPIILIGGLAGYLYHFRTKNPLKPLHAALPDSMQKALGFSGGSYSTITHMPGVKLYATSTSSTAAASSAATTPAISKSAAAAMTKTMPAFVKGNAEATQARISLLSAKKGAAYGGV